MTDLTPKTEMTEFNRSVHRVVCLLSFVLVSATGGLLGQDSRRVQAYAARTQRLDKTSLLQGEVLPLERMLLIPRVTGYIKTIHVSEGALVDRGAQLVTVDCPELLREKQVADAMVRQAEALEKVASSAVEAARQAKKVAEADQVAAASRKQVADIAVEMADVQFSRVKTLRAGRAATDEEWEEAQMTQSRAKADEAAATSAVGAAKARVDEAAAKIALREAELSQAQAGVSVAKAKAAAAQVFVDFGSLKNPYPKARITRQMVDAGTLAMANETGILEVMNVSRVRIRFGVPRAEAPFVKPGSDVRIHIPRSATPIDAKVTRVTGALTMSSRSMWAEVELDNTDNTWLPGSLFKVDLLVERVENALVIPARALISAKGDDAKERATVVWVAENGVAKRVVVAVGHDLGRNVQIVSGISDGAKVLVAGFIGLRDGDPVRTKMVEK